MPREQQPVTVVVPEGQVQQPVINVTVNIHKRGGGKWWLILIMAFLAYDWYFNGWGYTMQARDFVIDKISPAQVSRTYTPPNVPSGLPMNARYYAGISSGFGRRVIAGKRESHSGIDFKVPAGTPVLATAAGRVVRTGHLDNNCGYGVKIKHDGSYATIVCHLSKVSVAQGQYVVRGHEVGKSGGTPGTKGSGRSTGPHIHYAIKRDGKLIDPSGLITALSVKRPPKLVPCRVPTAHDQKAILNYVECRGARAGLPVGYMAVMAYLESRVDPAAHNDSSEAAGLYQFLPRTAKAYNLTNPYNIAEATTATIKYAKTFTSSQDAVILYMQHNQGACGYSIIVDMAALGKANIKCGGKTHNPHDIYVNIRSNVNGRYKRTVRAQGELNRKSASAYINFMTKVYWPKGVRQWKKITSR